MKYSMLTGLLFLYIFILAGCSSSFVPVSTSTSTNIPPTSTPFPTLIPTTLPTSIPTDPPNPSIRDRYINRTMEELISKINSIVPAKEIRPNELFMMMDPGSQFPSQVNVTYTGKFQDISEKRMMLIKTYLGSAFGLSEENVQELIGKEGLFIANGKEYWLPTQTELMRSMQDELHPGDQIILALIWIGATKENDQLDYIFVVNAWE